MDWQPIESAPKEKTILAWSRYCDAPVTVRFERQRNRERWVAVWDEQWVIESQGDFVTDYIEAPPLTHWMPLPEPPKD